MCGISRKIFKYLCITRCPNVYTAQEAHANKRNVLSKVNGLAMQASTLSCCTQWPVGPLDFKSYWPPKKVTGPNFFLIKNTFLRYVALQIDDASLAVISFTVGDLLLCFASVFRMADNVAARIFDNHN